MKMYSPLHELLSHSPDFTKLPSKKEEKWRFSSLFKYLDKEYQNSPSQIQKSQIEDKSNFLEVQDGQLISHQLPSSVHIKEHSLICEIEHNPFASLASHSSAYPLELNIFENVDLNLYFHYSSDHFLTSNLNIILQDGVTATIYLYFQEGENSFISHANHIKLESKSRLYLSQEKHLSKTAVLISQDCLHLHEKSYLQNFNLFSQGEYLHHFCKADLHYQSEINISSLLLSSSEQRDIFSCDINHLADQSKSQVLSKQVIKDKSTCVFDANTMISKDTNATQAKQSSHALLLSDTAQIHAKPHLEIYSDDLSASHGSTVGELDELAIDYLLSRGISLAKAKEILISAFVHEVIEGIEVGSHQERVFTALGERDD